MEHKFASLEKRAKAYIIDTLILSAITVVVLIPYSASMLAWSYMTLGIVTVVIASVLFNLWILYFAYFEWAARQTPGKRFIKIKIAKEDGSPLYFTDTLMRNLVRMVDDLPIFHIVGFASSHASPKNQRLGDLVARTVVVEA